MLVIMTLVVEAQQEKKPLAPPSGDPSFIVPGAKLELLVSGADYSMVFAEGAAVGCDGKVYFSDITLSSAPASKVEGGGILAGII